MMEFDFTPTQIRLADWYIKQYTPLFISEWLDVESNKTRWALFIMSRMPDEVSRHWCVDDLFERYTNIFLVKESESK